MSRQRAIVLRSYYPEKLKLSVLDEHLGHIEVTYRMRNTIGSLCHGALIEYQRDRISESIFIADRVELVDIPFWLACHDMQFLHQLLEYTSFFASREQSEPQVFKFLLKIYKKRIKNLITKKIILCKLLYLLGVCPEDALHSMPDLFCLISSSDRIILKKQIHEQLINDLDQWLIRCIALHPHAHKLKSVTLML